MGQGTGYAVLSDDGAAWRTMQVMPRPEFDLLGLAVAGDLVLGVEPYAGDQRVGVWRGRLSFMGG